MFHMRKRGILLGLFMVLALIAAACGGSSDSGDSDGGTDSSDETRTVRVGGDASVIAPEVRSLDPALVVNSTTQGSDYISAIYDSLYTVDPETNEIQPRIATDFTSEDGLTWTLTLKDGVTFSDGSPFDAEAVRFNWDRSITNPRAASYFQAVAISTVTVTSPTTLEVVLKAENRQFFQVVPASALTWIASPASVQAAGADFGNAANVIGAGPFVVTERTPNAQTVMARNESYWQEGLPKLDSITFKPVADQQQAVDSVITGGSQAYLWTPKYLAEQAVDQGFGNNHWAENQGGTSLLMNQNKPPFDNPKAREAVTLALDIQAMIDTVFQGGVDKMDSMFREGSAFYDAEYTFPQTDPEEAQRLFDEIATETGGPLSFNMTVSTNTVNTDLMKALQTQLAAYENVETELKIVDGPNYGVSLFSGDFNLALYAVASPDPVPQFTQFSDAFPLAISHLGSPKADQAIIDGQTATDEAGRKAAYDSLQQVLVEEFPQLWMYRNDLDAIYQSDMGGLVAYGMGSWLLENFGFMG
jgi:peptide/nickel transport system substrate-binding protein